MLQDIGSYAMHQPSIAADDTSANHITTQQCDDTEEVQVAYATMEQVLATASGNECLQAMRRAAQITQADMDADEAAEACTHHHNCQTWGTPGYHQQHSCFIDFTADDDNEEEDNEEEEDEDAEFME